MKTLTDLYVAARRVQPYLPKNEPRPTARNNPELKVVAGTLEFKSVVFAYQAKNVLENIEFSVHKGEMVGLVGGTGSGKSTIARLIAGYLSPTGGRITIDGQDISTITSESLLANINWMPQEPEFLSQRSILENLDRTETGNLENIQTACRAACIHERIQCHRQGYNASMRELESEFSGGEKQKLSFARMLLGEAPFVILDEPTSALDSETETALFTAFRQSSTDKTTILITHRLSVLQHADSILFLRNGQVAEKGTHAELLQKQGHYAEY